MASSSSVSRTGAATGPGSPSSALIGPARRKRAAPPSGSSSDHSSGSSWGSGAHHQSISPSGRISAVVCPSPRTRCWSIGGAWPSGPTTPTSVRSVTRAAPMPAARRRDRHRGDRAAPAGGTAGSRPGRGRPGGGRLVVKPAATMRWTAAGVALDVGTADDVLRPPCRRSRARRRPRTPAGVASSPSSELGGRPSFGHQRVAVSTRFDSVVGAQQSVHLREARLAGSAGRLERVDDVGVGGHADQAVGLLAGDLGRALPARGDDDRRRRVGTE